MMTYHYVIGLVWSALAAVALSSWVAASASIFVTDPRSVTILIRLVLYSLKINIIRHVFFGLRMQLLYFASTFMAVFKHALW